MLYVFQSLILLVIVFLSIYSTCTDSSLKREADGEYDYVGDGRGSLPANTSVTAAAGGPVYQEAVPYHSTGPDVSKRHTSSTTNTQPSNQLVVIDPTPNVYEDPGTHNITVR